jgi:hypothetical protein
MAGGALGVQVSSTAKRAKLAECRAFLREGDVLTVTKPDRLRIAASSAHLKSFPLLLCKIPHFRDPAVGQRSVLSQWVQQERGLRSLNDQAAHNHVAIEDQGNARKIGTIAGRYEIGCVH